MAEISEGVIAATRFFGHVNHRFWQDARVRVFQDDARHFLGLSDVTYDVIISEPSNPWMAGIVNLHTREFFELAAGRLGPDGLFCQWIHTYEISLDLLRQILRTFHGVFPSVRVFFTGTGADILILGCRRPIEPTEADVVTRCSRAPVARSLGTLGIMAARTRYVGSGGKSGS